MKSTKEKSDEISKLYEETKIISSYIRALDEGKPEIVPGMNQVVSEIYSVVESTYIGNDLRGLKMINRDFKEMAQNLKTVERIELKKRLELEGFNI